MNDHYDDLFVSEEEPRELIAKAVRPFMKFTPSGKPVYEKAYDLLNGKQKILVHLLASKILAVKGLNRSYQDKEGMHIKELAKVLGKKTSHVEGYVYGAIKDLVISDKGRIFIPNYNANKVVEELLKNEPE